MKKLMLTAMVVAAFLFTTQKTEAQVRVNLNVNLGRPSWGLQGNHSGNYYYLPEIDSYYDIPRHQFIYFDGRNWVYNQELPYQYRDYDLFGGYKVIVNEPRPYLRADVYRRKYNKYYNTWNRRPVIGNRGHDRYDRNDRYDNRNDRYDNRRYNDRDNRNYDNKHREAIRNDRNDRYNRNDNRGRG
jgi:hypothetical protein